MTSETKNYTDEESEFIFASVFIGSPIPKELASNAILRGISCEGRVVRWLSAYIVPGHYELLRADPCKSWHEASAQSYFLDGIVSRVAFSFYEYCKNLCSGEGEPFLAHMSLLFDGADVLIRPFPGNFRTQAETWIEERTGLRVFFGSVKTQLLRRLRYARRNRDSKCAAASIQFNDGETRELYLPLPIQIGRKS